MLHEISILRNSNLVVLCYTNLSVVRIMRMTSSELVDCGSDIQLMVREEDIERASRSLKAMSHPLRLRILCTLGNNEVNVQDIVECVGTSQSNISQHLAILRDKGILASRKDANRVFYRVSDARTLRLIDMMQEVFCSGP